MEFSWNGRWEGRAQVKFLRKFLGSRLIPVIWDYWSRDIDQSPRINE